MKMTWVLVVMLSFNSGASQRYRIDAHSKENYFQLLEAAKNVSGVTRAECVPEKKR